MNKGLILLVCGVLASFGAQAACTAESASSKATDISGVLMEKVQTNVEKASAMMNEVGTIMGGTVTEQTCTKLDDLMVRAKKL